MIDIDESAAWMRKLNDSRHLELFHLYAQDRTELKRGVLIKDSILCTHCKIID
jgi:hypothetical protein